MATAEPTRADDADPGPGAGPRPRVPEPRRDDGEPRPSGSGPSESGASGPGASESGPSGSRPARPEPVGPKAPSAVNTALMALRERMLRHPVLSVTALAGALHIVWFFTFANSGGDLAAQDAWAEFVGRHPDSAYNLAWYGGMHPVSYSVISPYLMSVLGVRTTMMIAGTVSAGLLTMVLIRSRVVRNPLWASLAGLFGLLANAVSGRVTFGLGMMFGLGAVAAVFCWPYRWRHERWAKGLCAAPLAALSTMASPVSGLFVGLVAVALFLQKRRPGAWALGVAPSVVVALSAVLFPFSGTQPMGFGSAVLPVLYAGLVYWFVPRTWTTVRITSAVYGLAVLLVWLISSQIGSNITRLAMLFAGVALVAALPFTVPKSRKWYALVVSLVGFVGWIGFKSADDAIHTQPAASWARELAPLVNELQKVGAEQGRVEAVPARSHREASALAPYVNLARGWTRQADMERNPLFYDDTLNSANYHEWLRRWAVHYVVLPKGEPDGDGGKRERELLQRGLPYLKQVWGDANWQLFKVTDPTPLAEPDAIVRRAEQDEWVIDVQEPGRILVRMPYSPWLSLVDEEGNKVKPPQETEASENAPEGTPKTYDNVNGCVTETEETADGDVWTTLVAPEAGTYRLSAPYGLKRGTPCPDELK
ncbi:MFS transporter [Streptomyces coelicoflavus]|uniref:glycosyltransferase family 87 protein n=1 Tax=Streptomyces TaxID=1883 RepID=UPI00129178D9|nr:MULTISPECIES: glycosyltransferase family 87 protein [Streptomyces]MCX5037211.1 MFS transporter [Streptomyces coelicoflavus]QFX83373.1 MFS transporter [Streptomyces sp. SYP-A7193]